MVELGGVAQHHIQLPGFDDVPVCLSAMTLLRVPTASWGFSSSRASRAFLVVLCRGGSASSGLESKGPMTMMVPKWSWYAVAMAPLEMHRRMERRIAGLIVNGSETEWSKDSDSGRILLAECPALRRHQNLVKNLAMMMRSGMDR